MQSLTAQQLAEILGTAVAAGCPGALVSGGVSTDTRNLPQDSAFFALRGENFDGDAFAGDALAAGAAAVVVSRWTGGEPAAGGAGRMSDSRGHLGGAGANQADSGHRLDSVTRRN